MKKRIALFILLLAGGVASARQPASDNTVPTSGWIYAQLIVRSLPVAKPYPVLFDCGQRLSSVWSYDTLKDETGNELLFTSGMAALNYLTGRGWEFVQAFCSGEDNDKCHYIVRIAADRLPDTYRSALAPPGTRPKKENMK